MLLNIHIGCKKIGSEFSRERFTWMYSDVGAAQWNHPAMVPLRISGRCKLCQQGGWNLHQAADWYLKMFAPAIIGTLGQGAIIGLIAHRTFQRIDLSHETIYVGFLIPAIRCIHALNA